MVKLNKKIKAFTILESMVSIVIVMIVFGMTSMVIVNVTTSGMTREKQNAHVMINALRNETFQQKRFIDESITLNELLIEKTVLDYEKNEELKVLLLEVFKGPKKLLESRDLILLE